MVVVVMICKGKGGRRCVLGRIMANANAGLSGTSSPRLSSVPGHSVGEQSVDPAKTSDSMRKATAPSVPGENVRKVAHAAQGRRPRPKNPRELAWHLRGKGWELKRTIRVQGPRHHSQASCHSNKCLRASHLPSDYVHIHTRQSMVATHHEVSLVGPGPPTYYVGSTL